MLPSSVYQAVFHSSPVGEYLLSPDAIILDVNDSFLQTACRTREELIGKQVFEVFPDNPDDTNDTGVAALRKSLARVVASGKPDTLAVQRYPILMTQPDGSRKYEERYWSVVNTPIFDQQGRLQCISHSTMDVTNMIEGSATTAHARTEAGMFTRAQTIQQINHALEAERARLRHLFEHAPGFVFFTRGSQHVFEQANDAFLELVGSRPVLGKSVRDAFPELAGQGFYELLDKVYRSGQPYRGNARKVILHRVAGAQPEERFVDLLYQPIVDEEGQVLGVCGQGHDITDKIHIEAALRSSVTRQSFQLELADRLRPLAAPDDIVAAASEMLSRQLQVTRVMYWEIDDTTATFFIRRDWDSQELPSVAGEIRHLEDLGAELLANLRAGEAVIVHDVQDDAQGRNLAKCLAPVPLRASLALPLVKAGQLTAVLSLVHSQPRQWTDEDLQLSRDVAERTWSAMEGARAQDELREANLRKDEFLAMLAHELRNPLAPISAAAELMKMVRLNEALVKQTSQLITRQVNHMSGLVDDLLDVSRVTRGLVTINKSPQEVRAIMSSAVEQVRPLIEAQGHDLNIELPAQPVQVLGDQKRLIQILTNLLNNASKYTPPGGQIQLKVELLEDRVLIHVKDNGIGITPELQARVFDLFSQAERSADRSQGGLGLGLALVKSLIERHDGTVTCHSDGPGQGSCFTICLPRLIEETPAGEVQQEQFSAQTTAELLRILVVDDNVDAAETLSLLLQASGHEVLVEFGALEGLERARNDKPDVCLLDIGLPEIDGNELARRLRSQPETADVTLIAITGYGQEKDRKNALEAGFNHHLVKPVDTAKLNQLLGQIAHA